MILLDTSETLNEILRFLPPAHPLRSLALELAASSGSGAAGSGSVAAGILDLKYAGRPGTIGILGGQDFQDENLSAIVLWLEDAAGQDKQDSANSSRPSSSFDPLAPSNSSSPSFMHQLVLDLAPGRYKAEYWGADSRSPIGIEIATGSKLVLAPPKAQKLVVAVRML